LIYTYLGYMYLIYIYITYIPTLYIPNPTYNLHYLNTLPYLAIMPKLNIYIATNMATNHFLII